MSVNMEAVRHLAKSLLSCALLSLCGSGSVGVLDGLSGFKGSDKINSNKHNTLNTLNTSNTLNTVSSAVRWASVVVVLSALYYLQFQVCVRLWQRKKERRSRGRFRPNFSSNFRSNFRSQYRQTGTTATVDPASASVNVVGTNAACELDELDTLDTLGTLDTLDTVNESESLGNSNAPNTDLHADSTEVWVEGASVVSNTVYYPELTMTSVWTYVYGWGLLLFVCVYCLAGVDVPCSCWWVMGMIALSFDELISKGMGKWFVCLVGVSLSVSVFAVWSGSLMDGEGNFVGDAVFNESFSLPSLLFGVVLPVSVPFIFFSIRSTVRSVTQDVSRLCEFALPFMTVLALCCLVATSGVCSGEIGEIGNGGVTGVAEVKSTRRSDSNSTGIGTEIGTEMVETVAKFASSYVNNFDNFNSSYQYSATLQHLLIIIAPLAAFWLIRVLVVAILTRHATEFISAFILVTSIRFSLANPTEIWALLAISSAAFVFVFLLFDVGRR